MRGTFFLREKPTYNQFTMRDERSEVRGQKQDLHIRTMVVMAARAEYVRATPILTSKTTLVTTATNRKSLAGAGPPRKMTNNMATSRNRP